MTNNKQGESVCPHVTLTRQNVAEFHWWICKVCNQKFHIQEWDGKMKVVS